MRRAALLGLVVLAGCGSEPEGLIPTDRGELLSATLRELDRAVAADDCSEARTFLARAETRVANLPASVDDRLVDRLEAGLERLGELVPDECRPEQEPEEEQPESQPETTAPPTTAPPTTAPPTTAPPTTQPPTTTAPPAEEEPVPETPVPEEPTDGTGGTPGGEGALEE